MANTMETLPPEVLSMVMQGLTKHDLKELSGVSKYFHAAVDAHSDLWRSITIETSAEYHLQHIRAIGFPESRVKLVRQLNFCSEFRYNSWGRCPHVCNEEPFPEEREEIDPDDEAEDEESEYPRFNRLTRETCSLVDCLEENQLQEFRWNLGTCVPPEILGPDGTLTLGQPSLRSLSITTDPTCYECEGCEEDLSSFCQLKSLCWRGPRSSSLEAICTAVQNNSKHLEKLELDFVNWTELAQSLDHYYNDAGDEDGAAAHLQNYFARDILRLGKRRSGPSLPAIHILNLTQVPVGSAVAPAINFDTLESLTLRLCLGWDRLLKGAVKLNQPIRLQTLEIQTSHQVLTGSGTSTLVAFLNSFEGLEELYIAQAGITRSLKVWNAVARRHRTLKKFVHHLRTIDIDFESDNFEEEFDLPDLAILGSDLRRMVQHPGSNPLAHLNLEFVGLACAPNRLKFILLPYASKISLKVIHIRQSGKDLDHWASWAIQDFHHKVAREPGAEPSSNDGDNFSTTEFISTNPYCNTGLVIIGPTGGEEALKTHRGRRLRDDFRKFAEWAFGPRGITSLHTIAFGDFAYGGREATQNNLLLRREAGSTFGFRLLHTERQEWMEFVDEYNHELTACPVEPLFGRD